jgi:hypothetical protein
MDKPQYVKGNVIHFYIEGRFAYILTDADEIWRYGLQHPSDGSTYSSNQYGASDQKYCWYKVATIPRENHG